MRREDWGTFVDQDGREYRMIRGPHNRTWFEDEAGEQVGPTQSNIYPAMCWMYASTDWFDPTDVMLTAACRREVHEKTRYFTRADR